MEEDLGGLGHWGNPGDTLDGSIAPAGAAPCLFCEGTGLLRATGGGEMCGLCRATLTYSDEQVTNLVLNSLLPCGHLFLYTVALHRFLPCPCCEGNHGTVTEAACAQLAAEERVNSAQWHTPYYRLPAPERRRLRNRIIPARDTR